MTNSTSRSLSEVVQQIKDSERRSKHSRIIAIDGPAGSGKTTLAQKLQNSFPQWKVEVVHMDDLYDGWENALTNNLTRILEQGIAKPVSEGKAFEYRKFDWLAMRYGELKKIPNPDLLILEGVGSGQKAVRKYLDQLIWIDIDSDVGLNRVLSRDGDYMEMHMRIWQMRESEHFKKENTRDSATMRLDGMSFI
jgi:uridine kinase